MRELKAALRAGYPRLLYWLGHATPGQGTIGAGLRRLIAHPLFAPLPCILEISGSEVIKGIAYLQGTSGG